MLPNGLLGFLLRLLVLDVVEVDMLGGGTGPKATVPRPEREEVRMEREVVDIVLNLVLGWCFNFFVLDIDLKLSRLYSVNERKVFCTVGRWCNLL